MEIDSQIAEADRELRMRERLYPRMVRDGRMHPSAMEHGLSAMREIRGTLTRVKQHARHLATDELPLVDGPARSPRQLNEWGE